VQTAWLERTLAAGRRDDSVDWIIVQMHQCACSSSATGNGSDLGIRQQWLPLFDRYEVDLVLNGHDHDYERSFPVHGADANLDDYGIAVFDVNPDPEDFDGHTSITVTQYHAVGADPVNPTTGAKGAPTPDYTEFETFTLIRPRRG
jgi:3',5'-cyclic AMP phosphodiesterase CpdA